MQPETLSVLIIDDDEGLTRTVGDILRLHGYSSVSANTAAEGLQLAVEEDDGFPVALVDLRLPDMGGLELISRIGELTALTEIVILTGNASLESAIGALREHSFDYLVKPVAPDRLVSTVERGVRHWQHKRAEENLRLDRLQFQHLVEAISEVVTMILPDGRIQYQSPSGQRMLGYGAGELEGTAFLDHVEPLDRDTVSSALAVARVSHGFDQPVEFRFRRADGGFCLFEAVASRMHARPDAPVVLSCRDIMERRRLEKELLQAQKMESVGRLAGGIAHDFNNQLTAILASANLAATSEAVPEPVLEELEEIRLAGQRAARLTRQLLIFSRKHTVELRNVDLNELIDGMTSMLRRIIPADIEVKTEMTPDLPPVHADRTELEQVVVNLAVNARDAVEAAGSRIVLRTYLLEDGFEVSAKHDSRLSSGPVVILEVEDDGEGMDDEVRERIFEPFFTTKGEGRGTGLGLATSYGIISRLGGLVRVRSRAGEGATFQVALPVSPSPAEPAEKDAVPEKRSKGEGQELILLVEDENAVRRALSKVLSRGGYRVVTAKNGSDALDIMEELGEPIDLLVTDLIMPGMSGAEVASAVKAARPAVRVLYTSGYADADVVSEGGLPFGGNLITKPMEPDELLRRVEEALEQDLG